MTDAGRLLEIYREASLVRWRATSRAPRDELSRPGLHGLLSAPGHPSVVLFVSDDRSVAELDETVARAPAGMIHVLAAATRSVELLRREPAWRGSPLTAMVCTALARTPVHPLPSPFSARPVRRVDGDPADPVALADAVACVVRAAPGEDPAQLSAFLRSLPALRLFAAVDAEGTVRATAGYDLIDDHARVLVVDTDPDFQRRGLATALTSIALDDARRRGARHASLDASDSGGSVYRRLGFETVGPIVRFTR